MLRHPDPTEYDPFYETYVGKVPDGDVVTSMGRELEALVSLLGNLPAERETYRYAPDKWSIREIVGHLIDSERLFGYRALSFARGDAGPLPGMEADDWARASNANERPLGELMDELRHVRLGHVAMFGGFDETMAMRTGIASGCSVSVGALAYIIVGHEMHHRGVLRERYLRD